VCLSDAAIGVLLLVVTYVLRGNKPVLSPRTFQFIYLAQCLLARHCLECLLYVDRVCCRFIYTRAGVGRGRCVTPPTRSTSITTSADCPSPSRAAARTAAPATRRGRLHAHKTGGPVLPSGESTDIILRPRLATKRGRPHARRRTGERCAYSSSSSATSSSAGRRTRGSTGPTGAECNAILVSWLPVVVWYRYSN